MLTFSYAVYVSGMFWFKCHFLLFLGMVIYDNEFEQKKLKFKPRIELNYNIYIECVCYITSPGWISVRTVSKHQGTQYSTKCLPRYRYVWEQVLAGWFNYWSGAPNEDIVQNHLNIALLNVFYYLNGTYRHIFIPLKFFHLFGFLSWKSCDAKL